LINFNAAMTPRMETAMLTVRSCQIVVGETTQDLVLRLFATPLD